ncbi:hypothetical protein MJO28_004505 [Puccinia striiformis f. sp. tritici]|uniref:Uncharacterized protein n=1 Tax=Puccinia striiformis f. sp. tritici TaxID=168172 RepID=A0ACC0EQD6_9BASI|nr:hypothetical protein MJO28_004505 [Puccinia striiformis f. sp. tritici]
MDQESNNQWPSVDKAMSPPAIKLCLTLSSLKRDPLAQLGQIATEKRLGCLSQHVFRYPHVAPKDVLYVHSRYALAASDIQDPAGGTQPSSPRDPCQPSGDKVCPIRPNPGSLVAKNIQKMAFDYAIDLHQEALHSA